MTYLPAWHWFFFVIGLTLASAYMGWSTYKKDGITNYVFRVWALAAVLGIVWFPQLLLDRLRINSEGIQWQTGAWWYRTNHIVRYADVSFVRIVRRKTDRATKTFWIIREYSGRTYEIYIGDVWEDHYDDIASQFRKAGIPVEGSI